MFLKFYIQCSDDTLAEMLNGNIHMQLFCGVLIDPSSPLKNGRIISAIRNRIGRVLDIDAMQKILMKKWKPSLNSLDCCMTDATCYESHLRYPTDVKLLWESSEWLHHLIEKLSKQVGEKMPRSKYNEVAKTRLSYAKHRKHPSKETRKIQRRLIALLSKLVSQYNTLLKFHFDEFGLTTGEEKRVMAVKAVLSQQTELFEKKEVKHRIVSIDRPYLRPIVRGKENKRVEFGAKVNNIQVDGISFIEHHSFEAFNEGIRLKQCVKYQEELTGVKVTKVAADSIYANNANRTFCSENKITTSFIPKGPKTKDEESRASRCILGNLRATVMEGSFGNQKQHYGVGRIAARNRWSETTLLFFGIHMANAALLAEREWRAEQEKVKKKSA